MLEQTVMDKTLKLLRSFDGVLEVAPVEGDDVSSDLDRPGRWRLNIHVGRDLVAELTPDASAAAPDPAASDTVLPHPLYGRQGWIAIVEPGPATADLTERLLRKAHDDDRRRVTRSDD